MSGDEVASAFHAWVRRESSNPNVLRTEGVELHKGRDVYKSASVRVIGDPTTGQVYRRELRLAKYPCRQFGPGFDMENPDHVWTCENDQIERVQGLLNGTFEEDGYYVRVNRDSDVRGLVERLASGELEGASLASLVTALTSTPGVAEALADADGVDALLGAVEYKRQRQGLEELRRAALDPDTIEQVLQRILERHWWVFGGRYVAQAARRKLTLQDQIDLPLLRTDGSLHVVELKQANVPRLVVRHRNHIVVGPDVHLATAQVMSYLRALDRQETAIRAEFGIDCQRTFATVVIGHSAHVSEFSRIDISEALRTYNSHLSRIEVVTYEDLIDGADRALALGMDDGSGAQYSQQDQAATWEPPF